MWKSKTCSDFDLCCGWNNGVGGSWTTWFLDFNTPDAWNKRGGGVLGPFLISVVAEITELWVENSQKANCRGVASIPGWGGSNGLGNKIIDLRIIMEIATLGYIVMRETKLD